MVDIFVEDNLLDIGYGMPIQVSSVFGGGAPPPHLVPSADPAAPFFRTDVDESPWLLVDLRSVRNVSRIRVFNNENEPLRGVPLSISISEDGSAWKPALLVSSDFGGKVTRSPAVVHFKFFSPCRYVKLQSLAPGSLRLHYVEICAPLPVEYLGKLRNIRVTDTDILADYWHHDSYGFAWTFTCTLGMVFNARLLGICIDRIDYRLCLHDFKDDPARDAYSWLFEGRPRCRADQPDAWPSFERHGVYASQPLGVLQAYADLYFRPHPRVKAYAEHLVAAYRLDLSRLVVLLYRGTDKAMEVRPVTPASYAAVARSLQAREDGLAVLCQTDQLQAREAMADIPGIIWFSELPATDGSRAIHHLDVAAEFAVGKADLAVRLLAMIYLVAQAKYLVTHTGNIGAWATVYRGHTRGLYQFCEDGQLRGPEGTPLTLELEPLPE